jgi:hypothetical protein
MDGRAVREPRVHGVDGRKVPPTRAGDP